VLSLSLFTIVALVALGRGAGSRLFVGGTEDPVARMHDSLQERRLPREWKSKIFR
jgi:hypothetical protein